jgi:hypothetical protein
MVIFKQRKILADAKALTKTLVVNAGNRWGVTRYPIHREWPVIKSVGAGRRAK